MKKLFTLFVLLTASQIMFSQVLIDASFLRSFTASDITAASINQVNAAHDVDLYKVTYNTPDINGQTSIALSLIHI